MAHTDPFGFETVVGALFVRLDMGAPRFDATGIVRLHVDGQAVNLSADGRGYLLIEAAVGRVPEEPSARRAWRHALLRQVPGSLLVNEAGVFVRLAGSLATVTVQARYRLREARLDRLETMIEDVLFLADRHKGILDGTPRGAVRAAATAAPSDETLVVFRL